MRYFKPITDAVNDHFGLNPKWDEFMLPTPDDYDDEFILFGRELEIVTKKQAMEIITRSYGKEYMLKYSDNNSIDYYRRLADSDYFFRWL